MSFPDSTIDFKFPDANSTETKKPMNLGKIDVSYGHLITPENSEELGIKYDWITDCEQPSRYEPGGLHPVNIHDKFCDERYEVINKLGYGTYSTVWLAKDWQSDRWVALKIIAARSSESSKESHILQHLQKYHTAKPSVPGFDNISKPLHKFTIDGPNGTHTCLVSEPLGGSVADARDNTIGAEGIFPLQIARATAAHVIIGVAFLHRSGVVHGDLHSGNVLFRWPEIQQLSMDQMYARYGLPMLRQVERISGLPLDVGVPSHIVHSTGHRLMCNKVDSADIVITDFGEAYESVHGPPQHLNTPLRLCPPENLLDRGIIGVKADVWALGCTLVDILGSGPLFYAWRSDKDDLMRQIVSTVGRPSQHWWEAWENRHKWFKEDGTWCGTLDDEEPYDPMPTLETTISRFRQKSDEKLDEKEQGALLQVLRGMLTINPEQRFTIEDVINSQWMEDYGRPAIEALDKQGKKEISPPASDSPAAKGDADCFYVLDICATTMAAAALVGTLIAAWVDKRRH
ncbi:MAG: hypothetical protein Q9222_006188 [Ikaeria aurantiellina]